MPQTICSVCVMDNSDPNIEFFGDRGCTHCLRAKERLATQVYPGAEGLKKLDAIVTKIKHVGANKPYDCLIGVSGGVDSSYVLVKAKEMGLRPLAVHLDNGWNAELAVHNIRALVQKLGVDLVTYVVDWEEIRALQNACFRVPLVDIEIVSDHAIFATLFRTAAKHNIRYILSGYNISTESIMPSSWAYDKRDSKHVRAVYRRFGDKLSLKTYPFLSPLRFLYYIFAKQMRLVPMLNYISYNKADAIKHLQEHYDWRAYTNKHGESVFTRFYQDYYLPEKFGIDKRKAHYSSQIAAGQMTREEALALLQKPLFSPEELIQEKSYVLKKLGFSDLEFERILKAPVTAHRDLPNNAWMFDLRNPVTRFVKRVTQQES